MLTLTAVFWLISMADDSPDEKLLAHAIDARQRGLVEFADIERRLDSMGRLAGRDRLNWVLRVLAHDGSDSVFEARVRERLLAEGFSPSASPVPVQTADGRTVHLDIAFPNERVAIECVGFMAHSSRTQLDRDARRENAIALGREWLVLKLTWDRYLHDWDGFVDEVRRALSGYRLAVG